MSERGELVHVLKEAQKITQENENQEYNWHVYDSSLMEYAIFFEDVLPVKPEKMRAFIENKIKDRYGHAVGVDFGGTGSNLFEGFSRDFFASTFGMVLHSRNNDKGSGVHRIIEGDCLSIKGIRKFENILGTGKKVDLLFERMLGGVKDYPTNPEFLWSLLNRFYKLLNDGGIMFVQSPDRKKLEDMEIIEKWLSKLSRRRRGDIEFCCKKRGISFELNGELKAYDYYILYLRKLKGAPTELPKLV
jgi:hypothetical protein